jgi:hypothetical protein
MPDLTRRHRQEKTMMKEEAREELGKVDRRQPSKKLVLEDGGMARRKKDR